MTVFLYQSQCYTEFLFWYTPGQLKHSIKGQIFFLLSLIFT